MPSSTSHSRQILPRQALRLLGLALITFAGAALYTVRLNPEVRFLHRAIQIKRAWARELALESSPRFILAGGSSAAFSIDGGLLRRQHGLKLVNFGLHAGMAAPFLTAIAAREARSGDTLVLAMEPGLLTAPFTGPDLAAQMGMALGEPELIAATEITGDRVPWVESLVSLRPGAHHAFTLLGKIALRMPLYRYSAGDFHPDGWQEAREFREIQARAPVAARLSPDADRLLDSLARWSASNGVTVRYSLPWAYVAPDQARQYASASAGFLVEISRHMPVLKDVSLGVHTNRTHFADTEWHLTSEGARERTLQLADHLRTGAIWTVAELERLAPTGASTNRR
jgi:hypothetical protein